MKKLVLGILAHVDAGKTTLSEALLYESGAIRTLGRVDHRDAFLDTDVQERERGITIYAKQAAFPAGETEIQLLDTPGHVDFSAEAERVLPVLDCAILVISGTDGVQSHSRTLWQLLGRYRVPTFLFLNKMDLHAPGREVLLSQLRSELSEGCVDMVDPELPERAAECDEDALEEYLATGQVSFPTLRRLIRQRKLFPCYFGSALKLTGVRELLSGLDRLTEQPDYPPDFSARVYKIARDAQGNRLTFLKVTGGELRVRSILRGERDGQPWEEKVNQIRLYSGSKFQAVDAAPAGTVCAVTGLTQTLPGDGLGAEAASAAPVLEPVLRYELRLEPGLDPHAAMGRLRQLGEEDPQLRLLWNGELGQIHVQLMGEVQKEVLQRQIKDRFGWEVGFSEGSVLYRETVAEAVEGIGHFEPLRHYAEVHLLIEPGQPGSGVQVASACSSDVLASHWQRLILSHVREREQPGVLLGAPLTDVKITLLTGRAHEKHTEGGDFRQATYRALRQGLMQTESVLLEPWYRFRIQLPTACLGRAMTDLQQMGAELTAPEDRGGESVLSGRGPVSRLRGYVRELAAYTRGEGRMRCVSDGYAPCPEQDAIVAESGYDPERDTANPADSVFCQHGAGVIVPWREVEGLAHLPSLRQRREEETREAAAAPARRSAPAGTFAEDKELQAIFERTYGKGKQRSFLPGEEVRRREASSQPEKREIRQTIAGPEYLLVDGYNVIFAWDELKAIARDNLDAARKSLMDLLSNYQGFRKCRVILVFDAYKVPGGQGSVREYEGIFVVYTKERQTADAYIEKTTYELRKEERVRVVTSDNAEQLIILGHGALRVSASAFHAEIEAAEGQIADILRRNNQTAGTRAVRTALEKAGKMADGGNVECMEVTENERGCDRKADCKR